MTTIKVGDKVTHVNEDWEPPAEIESVNAEDFPEDPVAFFVGGGFWRTSRLKKAEEV